MHHLAHLVPQAAVATQTGQASSARVKAVDDGAFGESLRSSLLAASVPSSKVPAASAPPTQTKQAKRDQQADVEEQQVSSAVSPVTPAPTPAPAPSNAVKPVQTQDTVKAAQTENAIQPTTPQDVDQFAAVATAKKTAARLAAPQKAETKSTKDAVAQDTDAAPVQTAVDASKEIPQPPQVAIVAVVPVPVEPSNLETQKIQGDGVMKTAASSAAGTTARAAKAEIKKVESAPGASATPVAVAQSSTTATVGFVPVTAARNAGGSESAGTGGTGLVVVAHAPAATSTTPVEAAPKVSHAEAITAASAQVGSPDVQTLVATQKVLEIGVASDSHGWLRVRAQMDSAGDISAAVVATSAGAAEGLHRELPAISAYLAGEQVGLSSLVVHAAGSLSATQDSMYGSASGTGSSAGSSAGKESNQAAGNPLAAASGDSAEGTDLEAVAAMISLPSAVFANGTGSWLSVRV